MIKQAMATTNNGIDWNMIGALAAVYVIVSGIIIGFANKIFKFGQTSQKIKTLESSVKDIKKEIGEARKDLTKRIDEVLLSIANASSGSLIESKSPSQLTDDGIKVLTDSGMDKILDDNLDVLVEKVKAQKPKNAYQAEFIIMKEVRNLRHDQSLKDKMEEGAFASGQSIGIVLLVGAIYIRDKVIEKLGWTPEDIDKHTPGLAKNAPKKKK